MVNDSCNDDVYNDAVFIKMDILDYVQPFDYDHLKDLIRIAVNVVVDHVDFCYSTRTVVNNFMDDVV